MEEARCVKSISGLDFGEAGWDSRRVVVSAAWIAFEVGSTIVEREGVLFCSVGQAAMFGKELAQPAQVLILAQ